LTVPSEDVKWFLNNEELQESDKIKIVKDGKKHKIITGEFSSPVLSCRGTKKSAAVSVNQRYKSNYLMS
jgi:hypothetical protein